MALKFRNNANKVVGSSYIKPLKEYYFAHAPKALTDKKLNELLNTKRRYLSLQEYQEIIEGIVHDLKKPDFSFDILPTTQISNHGALGLAVLCGLTLKQALSIVLKFYRIRTQLFHLTLIDEDADTVSLQLDLQYPFNDAMRSTIELAFGTIHKSKKEILSLKHSEDAIYFSYPEPEYSDRYREFFDCPVYFNHSHNRFVFPKSQLKEKLRFANKEAHDTLLAQCETDLKHLQDGKDILTQVNLHLQECEQFPSLDAMAEKLHCSSRSLRRHLQQKHTQYQKLVTNERIRRAKVLLVESDLSITDIALQLNYSDAANFSKVFKKITGFTPANYRKQQTN